MELDRGVSKTDDNCDENNNHHKSEMEKIARMRLVDEWLLTCKMRYVHSAIRRSCQAYSLH